MQFLAKDGKTPLSEVNYDNNEQLDGLQWSKSFFKPGVLSYNTKAQMNHGVIVNVEKFDADGKYLDWSNNHLKIFSNQETYTEFLVDPQTKLITGWLTEKGVKVKIVNGVIDTVTDLNGRCLAYKSIDNQLFTESVNNQTNTLIRKTYFLPTGYKANIELKYAAGDFDFLMNGISNYGETTSSFWEKFTQKSGIISEKQFSITNNKLLLKKEVNYEKPKIRRELFFDDQGELIEYFDYEYVNKSKKWFRYNKESLLIDSYDIQEAKLNAYISEVANKLNTYIIKFVDSDTMDINGNKSESKSSIVSGGWGEDKGEGKANMESLISDTSLPSICFQLLPDKVDCDSLFKDTVKSLYYFNALNRWIEIFKSKLKNNNSNSRYIDFIKLYQKNIDINYVKSDESGFMKGREKRFLYDRSFLKANLKGNIYLFYYDFHLTRSKKSGKDLGSMDDSDLKVIEAELSRIWEPFSGYFTLINNKLIFLTDKIDLDGR